MNPQCHVEIIWCDASLIGLGVVLQMDGVVVEDAAWLRKKEDNTHIKVAELEAVVKGVNLALKWNIRRLQIMKDSTTVFTWLKCIMLNRSSRSERYEKFISSFNLEFALITPTRHSATGNTCIDHVIVRQIELKKVQTSISDFNITDHKCLSIRFESEDNNYKKHIKHACIQRKIF